MSSLPMRVATQVKVVRVNTDLASLYTVLPGYRLPTAISTNET